MTEDYLEIASTFLRKWVPSDREWIKAESDLLNELEEELNVNFPEEYKRFMNEFGAVRTDIRLLDAVCEEESKLPDINGFCSANELKEETLDWQGMGMPNDLVVFAGDCCGNKFCFKKKSSSVWFVDQDFDTVEDIAPSFLSFLASFNKLTSRPID